jgi:hypothetical protein
MTPLLSRYRETSGDGLGCVGGRRVQRPFDGWRRSQARLSCRRSLPLLYVARFQVIIISVKAFRSALAAGADLILNSPSDISKYLTCLVPFQASFQLISGW